MADAGFFKGTSADQDSRFANKQKKLLKQMKFPDNIDIKIDMSKVSLDVLKPWITKRLQELLGIEDDVVIEFVFNQLEDKNPDPKMMQINLTGFLSGSKARLFIGELWKFLASAQSSPDGIPAELVEMKKRELLKRQEEDDRLREIRKREEISYRQDVKPDIHKIDNKTNGRQPMPSSNSKSRNENGNTAGYKSRSHYDDDRRDHDRRRSPPKIHRSRDSRSPEPKARRTDNKVIQPISKTSEGDDDHSHRHEKTKLNPKSSSYRHHSSSKSPSHSRSPIKPSRKTEKHQQRSSSSSSSVASNASHQAIKKPEKIKSKPKTRSSSSSSSVSPSHQKNNKSSRKKTADLPDDLNEIKRRKINESNDQVNEQLVVKKKRKSPTPSPPRSKQTATKNPAEKSKVSSIKETKKNKKQSKRTRSSSASHSSSNSTFSSSRSSSSSNSESEKKKKQKKKSQPIKIGSSSRSRSPSPNRNRKANKKKDDHKSRKHSTHNSKTSSRKRSKHHQSNDNKRKSDRDRLDKSITKKTSRNESSSRKTKNKDQHRERKNRNSHQPSSDNEIPKSSTPPKKFRLESQIKVQTPPPSSKLSDNNKSQQDLVNQSSVPIKPNRTERIVVLEESRSDAIVSVSARVSITTKTVYKDKHPKNDDDNNNSSEDENEIDLRERLLREKAIKSMKRRQLTSDNDDIHTKTTTTSDRIVYDLD